MNAVSSDGAYVLNPHLSPEENMRLMWNKYNPNLQFDSVDQMFNDFLWWVSDEGTITDNDIVVAGNGQENDRNNPLASSTSLYIRSASNKGFRDTLSVKVFGVRTPHFPNNIPWTGTRNHPLKTPIILKGISHEELLAKWKEGMTLNAVCNSKNIPLNIQSSINNQDWADMVCDRMQIPRWYFNGWIENFPHFTGTYENKAFKTINGTEYPVISFSLAKRPVTGASEDNHLNNNPHAARFLFYRIFDTIQRTQYALLQGEE